MKSLLWPLCNHCGLHCNDAVHQFPFSQILPIASPVHGTDVHCVPKSAFWDGEGFVWWSWKQNPTEQLKMEFRCYICSHSEVLPKLLKNTNKHCIALRQCVGWRIASFISPWRVLNFWWLTVLGETVVKRRRTPPLAWQFLQKLVWFSKIKTERKYERKRWLPYVAVFWSCMGGCRLYPQSDENPPQTHSEKGRAVAQLLSICFAYKRHQVQSSTSPDRTRKDPLPETLESNFHSVWTVLNKWSDSIWELLVFLCKDHVSASISTSGCTTEHLLPLLSPKAALYG